MIQTLFSAPPPESGLFDRFKKRFPRRGIALSGQIDDIFEGKKEIDEELLDDLEMTLIGADVGVRTTSEILDDVRGEMERAEGGDPRAIKERIAGRMMEILRGSERPAETAGAASRSDPGRRRQRGSAKRRRSASSPIG